MKRLILAAALVFAGCSGGGTGATVTDAPTEEPTFTAEPTIDEYENLGVISFGKSFDEDTLEIVDERTKFKTTVKKIAWSAYLSRTVGATSMELVIASQSKSGSERVIISEEVDISNPESDLFANSANLALLVDNKAGKYVMRYIESGDVLAEGTFTLVK